MQSSTRSTRSPLPFVVTVGNEDDPVPELLPEAVAVARASMLAGPAIANEAAVTRIAKDGTRPMMHLRSLFPPRRARMPTDENKIAKQEESVNDRQVGKNQLPRGTAEQRVQADCKKEVEEFWNKQRRQPSTNKHLKLRFQALILMTRLGDQQGYCGP